MRLRRQFKNAASLAASASYAIACANSDLPGRQVSKCVLKPQRVSRHKSASPGLRSSSSMSSGSSASSGCLDGAGVPTADPGAFVVHQDLQTVLRCHSAALEAIGGVPREIRYDRMKAAVLSEDVEGLVVYNRARRSRSPLRLLAARLPALSGSSGRSDKSAGTSSSAAPSAISTTSTVSSAIGCIRSPILGCMPHPSARQ
jgi:hypothetical protein